MTQIGTTPTGRGKIYLGPPAVLLYVCVLSLIGMLGFVYVGIHHHAKQLRASLSAPTSFTTPIPAEVVEKALKYNVEVLGCKEGTIRWFAFRDGLVFDNELSTEKNCSVSRASGALGSFGPVPAAVIVTSEQPK